MGDAGDGYDASFQSRAEMATRCMEITCMAAMRLEN